MNTRKPLPGSVDSPEGTSKSEARDPQSNTAQAERVLWLRLMDRQVHGAKFHRQHAIGEYIADFVSFDAMVVIELDGNQKNNRDLSQRGFEVLSVWNYQVFRNLDDVMTSIRASVDSRLNKI
jgi:very-short-patch-repair endonuclease